ncbi:hypothetical protein [Haloferula sp.]|uniref:hypothetical protein n=1 Tax=Haloferula sp. TaxID=2497595 RepID=UPI003C72868E
MSSVGPGDDSETIGIFRRDQIWTLPSDVLPAADLSSFSKIVLDGWKIQEAYPSKGQGGGGSRFDFSFGDSQTHAQVLLTAFEEGGLTRIHSQACAIESPPNDDPHLPIKKSELPVDSESLDQLRSLFTSELERLITLYTVPSSNPRERNRYKFDSPGDGFIGATVREQFWSWTVPGEVLEANELRTFANRICASWDPAFEASSGADHLFSFAFGDGTRSAIVSIIAIPGKASARGGFSETRVHYSQLLFNGNQKSKQSIRTAAKASLPLDLEALVQVPGSSARELEANAKLDSDGRMLKSLRERARTSVGTWKIRYTLRFTLPPSEEDIESFATSRGMTWEMTTTPESSHREKWFYLRFFKIMEFSESTIVETTSAVRQFAKEHVGKYVGWGYSSDKITRIPSEDEP